MGVSRKKKEQISHAAVSAKSLQTGFSFVAQEAQKALRTNVMFSLPGDGCKCIAVTSAERGEGKSTNAINLAISFGQIGKKVLLIDDDLRLPTVASKLHIQGQPGLSNLLVGDSDLANTIQVLEKEKISVLPSGTLPPDPTSLLESKQMQDLMEQLRQSYDYIFLDLPPVTMVTDAMILSKCVDGFLLVIRHNSTEYRAVSKMLNQLRFADAKILGFIYTNAEVEGKKYYRHYYKGYGKQDNGLV